MTAPPHRQTLRFWKRPPSVLAGNSTATVQAPKEQVHFPWCTRTRTSTHLVPLLISHSREGASTEGPGLPGAPARAAGVEVRAGPSSQEQHRPRSSFQEIPRVSKQTGHQCQLWRTSPAPHNSPVTWAPSHSISQVRKLRRREE